LFRLTIADTDKTRASAIVGTRVLRPLTTLILCQFVGEVLARGLELPLPGPVVGLLILLGLLAWRGGPDQVMKDTSGGLLRHLSLLFVPAGVGVVKRWPA